jgi:protoporphyrinogen oxidase
VSSPTSQIPVAILGAGLTGLAAALELQRLKIPYRIFERGARAGGHAVTVEDTGYRFDRTGHLLHLRSPELEREVLDMLGGDCVRIERRSRVFSHGVYTRYPFQANTFGLPPEVAYECLLGFVKAHFDPQGPEPKSFADFCLRHFGDGFSRHFMLPYNEKLWGVPPNEITAEWCQRFVPLPKLEDVVAGALGLPDPGLGYNARFLYPRSGIGALPTALARNIQPIELGRSPRTIRARAQELVFDNEVVHYETLINTAPLPILLACIDELPAEVREASSRLRSTSLYYLDLALSTRAQTDFHWVYVPEARYPFYRVGCYTEFSEALAPAGCSSLYVELADRNAPNLDTLLPRVTAGLEELGVIASASDVRFARLRKLDFAYVIYDFAYEGALASILPFLESVHVSSAGRYGGWNYSSMEDALLFGRSAARAVAHGSR